MGVTGINSELIDSGLTWNLFWTIDTRREELCSTKY
jgi:hypothetical protein